MSKTRELGDVLEELNILYGKILKKVDKKNTLTSIFGVIAAQRAQNKASELIIEACDLAGIPGPDSTREEKNEYFCHPERSELFSRYIDFDLHDGTPYFSWLADEVYPLALLQMAGESRTNNIDRYVRFNQHVNDTMEDVPYDEPHWAAIRKMCRASKEFFENEKQLAL